MKVAIAGAGRGIGAACARALRGLAELTICARTADEIRAVAAETGARAIVADVSTDAGAEEFAAAAGAVDLALICVGSAHRAVALEDAGAEKMKKHFFSNAVAPAVAAGALLRRGAKHVFFLSSLATRRPPMPGAGPYTAAKAALESMVRTFAEECWPRARANALCLGPVRTQLHVDAGTPAEWLEKFPSAEEIAPLVITAAALPGTGRILDAEALQLDPAAALAGDGRLADVEPFREPPLEAEPGRGPSPRVRAALKSIPLQAYPRGAARLAARIASLHGVDESCVALSGGGATELIERAIRVFCSRGDEIVSPFPTFEVLSALCSREGVRHRAVPARRRPDGLFEPAHSAAPLLSAIGPRTRLLYVASPDNPTGATLPAGEGSLLERTGIPLVLDEAWSFEPPKPSGAIRIRSFSKLQGLAAMRVAYAIGPPEQIALLRKLELPFPLGAPQIAAADAVLDRPERTRRAGLLLVRERARIAAALRELGCAVSESPAPVLLVRHPAAARLLFALQAAGLPVQEAHWDPSAVVVPLGRRAQNDRAVSAARRALSP
ncbi:MAG: aminotransferase class I/II-fold pyridoxal phosphate-dependent enzyme [Myxococcales bacterium]